MNLREYVELQIGERLAGDPSRFDELWLMIPDLTRTLRGFDDSWLRWRRWIYDGYYCLPMDDGRWEVYYQECGSTWPSDRFFDERDAIHFALRTSGILQRDAPRQSMKRRQDRGD